MVPNIIPSLITDFAYYQDYYNLCHSMGLVMKTRDELIRLYAKNDDHASMLYLMSRDRDIDDMYRNESIHYNAYQCITMLCCHGYGKTILDKVFRGNNVQMFKFMKSKNLITSNPTEFIDNDVLTELMELYISDVLQCDYIFNELDRLFRYDLIQMLYYSATP